MSALQGGGERGHRVDAESAAGGHLIPVQAYRKSARVNADPESAETWVDDGLANTLNSFDVGDVRTTHAVVEPAIGFSHTQGLDPQAAEEVTPTLRKNGGGAAVGGASSVRRLTPLECERLQGWPEVDGRGWTDVPWNGKDHAPDSKRYQACGNGVTATVAYWIAARLAEVLK